MKNKVFDPKKLDKLNNPSRLKEIPPDYIIEKSGLKSPQVIVDVGAGTGFFSVELSKNFPDAKIYACDISPVMLDWIDTNIINKYKNIIPLLMAHDHLPLDDKLADFILMINLHHEIQDKEKLLNDCHRLLKEGGKIAILDWKKEDMPHGPPTHIRVEPHEVEKELLTCGFQNILINNELPKNFMVVGEAC